MSPRIRFPWWLWLVLAISTATSVWVAVERYRDESANKAVDLIVDMPDVRLLAGVSGEPVWEVLKQLKDSGATAVAVAEETIDDWIYSGKIRIEIGTPTRLIFKDPKLLPAIRALSDQRLRVGQPAIVFVGGGAEYPVAARLTDIRTFGLGFNSDDAFYVKQAGLGIVARLTNQPLGDRNAIDAMLTAAKEIDAEGILFAGDQVIGRRELIVYAAEKIRASGMWIGPVEFTTQGGLPRITKELQDQMVRVHSMVAAEIDRNEPPDIVDRYVRAVVERNIKALFLRPISLSSENPLDSFKTYLATIKGGLSREGYEAKPARPGYPDPRPAWVAVLCGLGIAAAGGFLAWRLLGGNWGIAVGGVLLLLAVGGYFGFGLKFLTLAGALVFPTLAMVAAFDSANAPGDARKWVFAFFWITGLSILGGLHIAALLTLPSYVLRLEQFYGVKVAHFLPPLFVAIYLLLSGSNFSNILRSTVRWMDMLVIAVVLAAVFVMLSRTGNDAPGDVSSIELKMRNILDRVLPERPRTKEFLIGHPSLIAALSMAYRGNRGWLPLAAFLASVGQVSVLNTFCHLHTPISVSVVRVLVGLLIGGVIGLMVIPVVTNLSSRKAAV